MSRAAEAAMAASYKALKEDFVSNLTGGEIGEINYVTAVAPVSSPLAIAERTNFWKGSSCSLVGTTVATVLI
jgi:phosphatidylinositol glycan class W